MNEKPKVTKKVKSLGIAICFVAAVAIVGTYTLNNGDGSETKPKTTENNSETEETEKTNAQELIIDNGEDDEEEAGQPDIGTEAGTGAETEPSDVNATSAEAVSLQFGESSELLWPVSGQILMNYSMDKTVYFQTLDQYKYNPALIISGAEGDQVISGAAGLVKSIDVTAQTGTTVNLDLGSGYELLIGQLKEVPVNAGDYVDANTVIGYVSQPTKYYSVEGCNVYYEMRKDGLPIDPLEFVGE